MKDFDITKVFTLYVLKTDIWTNLVTDMVKKMTYQRMGLSYHEIAELIEEQINTNFAQFYGAEEPTLENVIIRKMVNSADWYGIARYIYPSLYQTAMNARTTQADSYNEADELQKQFLDTEGMFFENKYLEIFSDFFSEIP